MSSVLPTALVRLRIFLNRRRYPQIVFARAIRKRLGQSSDLRGGLLIDIPCGAGEVAFEISRSWSGRVLGIDLSAEAVRQAQSWPTDRKTFFQVGDLYKALADVRNVDVICIVNSLFCLPDANAALKLAFSALRTGGIAFVVIPDVTSENFLRFQKEWPNLNRLAWSPADAAEVFSSVGFQVKAVETLARSIWYRRPGLRWMRSLRHVYLLMENLCLGMFDGGKGGYLLFELQKPAGKEFCPLSYRSCSGLA